jgi:hypothetical protein
MKRAMLENALARAEQHITGGEGVLARQKALIQLAELTGGDVASSKALLVTFEDTQALHVAKRDRLRKELSEFPDLRAMGRPLLTGNRKHKPKHGARLVGGTRAAPASGVPDWNQFVGPAFDCGPILPRGSVWAAGSKRHPPSILRRR